MSELESILNYLETTSMEPHDDYTSEFSYKEQKVLWKYIKQLQQENQELKKQIEYLKGGEYLNQLKFERNMLQDVVDKMEVSKEDKKFIDMTHRNTELLEENRELKDQLSNSHQIKTQQKEFIELLENEIALRERKTYEIAIIKDDTAVFVWKIKLELLKEVLSKYKELIGVKDE